MVQKNLKILESHKSLPVYFVRGSDKVVIQGKKKKYNIYKSGHVDRIENFNFDYYDKFIQEHGYQPSATKVGKVFPVPDSLKPGIEIMPSRKLFQEGGRIYYLMFDTFRLDSNIASDYREIVERRKRVRPQIDKFLTEKLYAPLAESREAYERNLVKLVKQNLKNPNGLFDLQILSEPKARWVRFNEINLEKALDKGVKLSIDWMLANKLLALYAIKGLDSR